MAALNGTGDFTNYMEGVFQDGFFDELKSFYSREDLETVLEEYDEADDDRRPFVRYDLEDICAARGLDVDKLLADRSMLETVPDHKEIQNQLLDAFRKMFDEFPKNAQFMDRLLTRLGSHNEGETARLSILKKFVAEAGPHFCRYDVSGLANRDLSDDIFNEAIVFEDEVKKEQAARIEKAESEGIKLTKDKKKQFRKDSIKSVKASFSQRHMADPDLLKICSDLAEGKFRVNGMTRVQLYYFAIMFGMTISINGASDYDPNTDVTKNLFQDYYNDNLLRVLETKDSSIESDVTGEGINYKNFAEAVYLYFIYNRDLTNDEGQIMTGGEKIDKAEEIIGKALKISEKKKKKGIKQEDRPKNTQFYRNAVQELFNQDVNTLAEYVADHYNIPSGNSQGRVMAASEQITASETVRELMEEMDVRGAFGELDFDDMREYREVAEGVYYEWNTGKYLQERFAGDENFLKVVESLEERLNSNSWKEKSAYINEYELEIMTALLEVLIKEADSVSDDRLVRALEKKHLTVKDGVLSNSIKLLTRMGFDIGHKGDNYYLSILTSNEEVRDILASCTKTYVNVGNVTEELRKLADKTLGSRRITRTELLAAEFVRYIRELPDVDYSCTFEDMYENFVYKVSPVLEKCRYQPISPKNFTDMYFILTLYIYMTENFTV